MQSLLNVLRRLTDVREAIPPSWSKVLTVFALIALAAAYTALSAHQHEINPNDQSVPTWTQFWNDGAVQSVEVQKRTGERWLVQDLTNDARRLGLGLALGILGAVFLGMNMGAFAAVDAVFNLPFTFISKIPPMAAFGMFFILFKEEEHLFLAVVVFSVLPTMAQSVSMTVKDFPDELRYKALTLGAGPFDLVWWIILRWSMPRVIDAVRLQIGEVVRALIAAEFVVGNTGFGSQIRAQMRNSNMAMVFTYVVIIVVGFWVVDHALKRFNLFTSPQLRARSN